MAISFLQPLSVGNAVRVFVAPPVGAKHWRVLRRTADAFTGQDDAGAVVVADNSTDDVVLDTTALINGTPYFYRDYAWDGAGWTGAASATATPMAAYAGDGADVVQIVRDRLDLGLQVEIARGALKPQSGGIDVTKSPTMLPDQIRFPAVYVHLDLFAPSDRALGDEPLPPMVAEDGSWTEYEGFRASWSLNIGGVSKSSDERGDLRRALVRILQANFPVFAAAGMNLVEFRFADSEQLQEQSAPLFMTAGTFTCTTLSYAALGPIDPIADVLINPSYDGQVPMEPIYD